MHVYTASLEYLFVTKIMANRSKDRVDIIALAETLQISKLEDVVTLVAQYVPEESLTEDLMDDLKEYFKS